MSLQTFFSNQKTIKKLIFTKLFTLAFLALTLPFQLVSAQVATSTSSEKVPVRPVEPFYVAVDESQPKVYEPTVTYLSPLKKAPINFTSLGATWNQKLPEGTNVVVEVRLKELSGISKWHELHAEIDFKEGEQSNTQASAFITNNLATEFQYRITLITDNPANTPVIENLKFTFINAGNHSESVALANDVNQYNQQNTKVIEPERPTYNANNPRVKRNTNEVVRNPSPVSTNSNLRIISRQEWGADEKLRLANKQIEGKEAVLVKFEDDYYVKYANELKSIKTVTTDANGNELAWPMNYPEKVSKIIVHHTASTNNLNDPQRAIRDIYYWHSISKGWGDIGYNYLIDQQGNIYEGRFGGETVVGAHAGKGNHGSIGIAILGNYQNSEPPEAVIKSLTALIKEKATLHNIDTEGSSSFRGINYPNVMGHRDVMTTACPGDKVYEMLPIIRKMAKANVNNSTEVNINIDYNIAYDQSPAVQKITMNARKDITLQIKNTGRRSWGPETYFQVNNNANAKSFLKNADGILSSKVGSTIEPGQVATVKLTTFAGVTVGSTVLDLFPMIDGTNKVGMYLPLPIQVVSPAAKLKYDYELVSIIYDKENFNKGDVVNARISMRNTGSQAWLSSGANRATLGADKPRDHVNNLLLTPSNRLSEGLQPDVVRPGEIGVYNVKVKIPQQDGIYREYFSPVVEAVQWMENRNSYLEIKIGNVVDQSDSPEPENGSTSSGVVASNSNSSGSSSGATTVNAKNNGANIAANVLDTNKSVGNIRIDLSYRGNPALISANGNFTLFEGNRQLKTFNANQLAKVELINGSFVVSEGAERWNIAGRPVFKPANNNVIMRIDNWERRNTWGDFDNNNEFRGNLEALIYDGELHIINELPLEDYMKGIAEESSTAPQEKIKTIMVLARTYARFYMEVAEKFPGAPFHLNDDPNTSQKYLGYAFEKRSPGTVAMVEATKGKVVTYNGKLIKTPYFSRSDGKATISAKDKWGWTDTPFLQSADDSHCDSAEFWGHGVGVSGCGATEFAKRGKSFEEIIKHYYQGVEITQTK